MDLTTEQRVRDLEEAFRRQLSYLNQEYERKLSFQPRRGKAVETIADLFLQQSYESRIAFFGLLVQNVQHIASRLPELVPGLGQNNHKCGDDIASGIPRVPGRALSNLEPNDNPFYNPFSGHVVTPQTPFSAGPSKSQNPFTSTTTAASTLDSLDASKKNNPFSDQTKFPGKISLGPPRRENDGFGKFIGTMMPKLNINEPILPRNGDFYSGLLEAERLQNEVDQEVRQNRVAISHLQEQYNTEDVRLAAQREYIKQVADAEQKKLNEMEHNLAAAKKQQSQWAKGGDISRQDATNLQMLWSPQLGEIEEQRKLTRWMSQELQRLNGMDSKAFFPPPQVQRKNRTQQHAEKSRYNTPRPDGQVEQLASKFLATRRGAGKGLQSNHGINQRQISFTIHRLWSPRSPILISQITEAQNLAAPVVAVSPHASFVSLLDKIKSAAGIELSRKVQIWILPPPVSNFWRHLLVDAESFLRLERDTQRVQVPAVDNTHNMKYDDLTTIEMTGLSNSQALFLDEFIETGFLSTWATQNLSRMNYTDDAQWKQKEMHPDTTNPQWLICQACRETRSSFDMSILPCLHAYCGLCVIAAFTGALESRSPWQCCGRIVDSVFGLGFLVGPFIQQYKELVHMEMVKTSRVDSQPVQSRRVETFMRAEQFTCLVCMDTFPESAGCILPCWHASCSTCIQAAFTTAFNSRSPFQCCNTPVPISLAEGLLPPSFIWQYQLLVLEKATKKPRYCYSCSTFLAPEDISGTVGFCPDCWQRTCTLCGNMEHAGVCQEDTEGQALLALAGIKGWKSCPGCQRLVEKDIGCLHMICRCDAQWCWNCGRDWGSCESTCPRT